MHMVAMRYMRMVHGLLMISRLMVWQLRGDDVLLSRDAPQLDDGVRWLAL